MALVSKLKGLNNVMINEEMTKLTLDIIGLASFDYEFNSLSVFAFDFIPLMSRNEHK
jgi:hypothetical protein